MSQDLEQNQMRKPAKVQWSLPFQLSVSTDGDVQKVYENGQVELEVLVTVSKRVSYPILGLFLALFVSGCASGPYNPLSGPSREQIKFQCYDQATGKWEDCPEILDEDMKCHEPEPNQDTKEQA
jgi:hypothetical protein